METRARHYSQTKSLILGDFGCYTHQERKKKLNLWWLWFLIKVIGDMRRSCTVIWNIYGFKIWSDLSWKKILSRVSRNALKAFWPSLRLVNATVHHIQHLNHQQPSLLNQSFQYTDAPLRVWKARKKKEWQWDTDRYSHSYRMNKLILMLVLFGYITNNNNQQNSITQRR